MSTNQRLPNLDKLRGFAALSVLVYHVIEHTKWIGYPTSGPLVWGRTGGMGVDIFFVISGLVITYTAWDLYRKYGAAWGKIYWQRRLYRIVPLYILTIVVFLVLLDPNRLVRSLQVFATHVSVHLLFIHNFFRESHGSINGVNWTIGVEMQFYLLIFLCLPWLIKTRISVVAAVFIGIAWIWRAVVFDLLSARGTLDLFHYTSQLPGSLDLFVMGILLCKVLVDPRYASLLERLRQHYTMVAAAAVAVCWLMLFVYWENAEYWPIHAMVVFFKSFIGFAAGMLVLAAVLCPWKAPRFIAAPFDFLGEISYGLYLWHLIVILLLKKAGMVAGIPFLAATLVLTTAVATLSYYFFERPWMYRGRSQPQLSTSG